MPTWCTRDDECNLSQTIVVHHHCCSWPTFSARRTESAGIPGLYLLWRLVCVSLIVDKIRVLYMRWLVVARVFRLKLCAVI